MIVLLSKSTKTNDMFLLVNVVMQRVNVLFTSGIDKKNPGGEVMGDGQTKI